jgi:hypothetical protein
MRADKVGQPARRQMLKNLAAAMIAFSLPEQGLSMTDVHEKMHTRLIPATREPLPVVGCGTYRTFDVGATPEQRAPLLEVLKVLFAAGGSVIDTSPMYGAAEHVVGDLLAPDRSHPSPQSSRLEGAAINAPGLEERGAHPLHRHYALFGIGVRRGRIRPALRNSRLSADQLRNE